PRRLRRSGRLPPEHHDCGGGETAPRPGRQDRGRGGRRREAGGVPRAEQAGVTMSDSTNSILVLVDVDPSGEAASSTAGLLGAAASLGTPVALVAAPAGSAQAAVTAAADAGATRVLTADIDAGRLTVPVVDALQAAVEKERP